eukprot:scaffold4218_cov99-Isochrysis_galbana.AAC.1
MKTHLNHISGGGLHSNHRPIELLPDTDELGAELFAQSAHNRLDRRLDVAQPQPQLVQRHPADAVPAIPIDRQAARRHHREEEGRPERRESLHAHRALQRHDRRLDRRHRRGQRRAVGRRSGARRERDGRLEPGAQIGDGLADPRQGAAPRRAGGERGPGAAADHQPWHQANQPRASAHSGAGRVLAAGGSCSFRPVPVKRQSWTVGLVT